MTEKKKETFPFTEEEVAYLKAKKQSMILLASLHDDVKASIREYIRTTVYPRLGLSSENSNWNLDKWVLIVEKELEATPDPSADVTDKEKPEAG